MSDERDCYGVGELVLDLQPLGFEEISAGDPLIYQAEVVKRRDPGTPAFRLTLSTSVAGNDNAKADIERLMRELRADFLLTSPWPADDPAGEPDPGPDDGGPEILIVPELARVGVQGSFGVVFVIQREPEASFGVRAVGGTLRRWEHHRYTAARRIHGTVTMQQGCATIHFRRQNPQICYPGPPSSTPVFAAAVTVHADSYCAYTISGGFND